MKLRTSYCKLTTFKKDLTRFAPVWALYLISMMMVLTEVTSHQTFDRVGADAIPSMIMAFGIVNLCYAGVCALVLFGDLYNTRMCYSLHTQPARRESLFASHLAAALCFSLVPNLLAALYLMMRLQAYWFLALYWLLASTLQFVFYFGLASVSAMCAGNRVGMLAVYAVLNFFSMIAYWVVETIYLPHLTGVVLNFEAFCTWCPTVKLYHHDYFQFERLEIWDESMGYYDHFFEYVGLSDGWGYLAILAGIGVAALALAVVLYRARHLESAGDFVAFRKLSPVVCVVLTVCVAVGFAFFGEIVGSSYMLWLVVGLVVGFFGSRMLLERRVKVFYGKAFLGLGVLAAVLVLSFLAISFDVFNIVGFLPDADRVESVTLSNYKSSNYYYEDYYYGNRISVTLEEPEQIEEIITAHEDILNRLDTDPTSVHRLTFTYKLKSGRTVIRSYAAPAYGTNYEIARKYFYTPQQVLGFTDWDEYVKNMEHLSVDSYDIPPQYREEFLKAMYADCEKGAITTANGGKEALYWVYLWTENADGQRIARELRITNEAHHTLAMLKRPEIVLGFENVADVKYINYVVMDGVTVDTTQRQALLEALLADAEAGNIPFGTGKETYVGHMVEYSFGAGSDSFYRILEIGRDAENTLKWLEGIKK